MSRRKPARLAGGDLRPQLFRTFHAVWSAINADSLNFRGVYPLDYETRVEQGLAALPPIERRVLLLAVIEDFSLEEIGQILDLKVENVQTFLAKARLELTQLVEVSALIIEDEPMIALEVSQTMQDMGVCVAKIVAHESAAVTSANELEPGLVLADIQLLDEGNGITAARAILQNYEVPIVFVTAFPERLLTGEGLEPAFVVAKPFTAERLKVTVAHALSVYDTPTSAAAHRVRLLEKLKQLPPGR